MSQPLFEYLCRWCNSRNWLTSAATACINCGRPVVLPTADQRADGPGVDTEELRERSGAYVTIQTRVMMRRAADEIDRLRASLSAAREEGERAKRERDEVREELNWAQSELEKLDRERSES